MIDTHSHIYGSEFDEDRDVVIQRAKEAGVRKILLPNINGQTVSAMMSLCQSYPGYCFPMIGLHPTDIEDDYLSVLSDMHQHLSQLEHPFVAVGEVGLDFYWDDTRREEQLEVFDTQIAWARDFRLPLMIHSRSAHSELIEMMNKHADEGLSGVFHCFGGDEDEARELLSYENFVLGIGGVVTYKKSTLPEVLREVVPLDRIVLETDSPYLAPVPNRGKRNESSFVLHVAQKLAEIYQLPVSEIIAVTSDNANRIFPRIGAV